MSGTRAELEKLSPVDGDILVLRAMNGAPLGADGADDPLRIVQQWLVDTHRTGVLIVALGAGQDIALLHDEDMAAAGWVRAPSPEPGGGHQPARETTTQDAG